MSTTGLRFRFMRALREFVGRNHGVAAIEFALISLALGASVLNTADISMYLYDRQQVENATEMGAQAAWRTCDITHLPATTNCPGLSAAVAAAIQSSSLGTAVTLQSGSPSEGYYCVNSGGQLQYMSSVSNKPADCTNAGMPTNLPGDYIEVQTSCPYTPILPGLSVVQFFTTPIQRTSWMRMG
jgi:Flp pilus assembly protein TadG